MKMWEAVSSTWKQLNELKVNYFENLVQLIQTDTQNAAFFYNLEKFAMEFDEVMRKAINSPSAKVALAKSVRHSQVNPNKTPATENPNPTRDAKQTQTPIERSPKLNSMNSNLNKNSAENSKPIVDNLHKTTSPQETITTKSNALSTLKSISPTNSAISSKASEIVKNVNTKIHTDNIDRNKAAATNTSGVDSTNAAKNALNKVDTEAISKLIVRKPSNRFNYNRSVRNRIRSNSFSNGSFSRPKKEISADDVLKNVRSHLQKVSNPNENELQMKFASLKNKFESSNDLKNTEKQADNLNSIKAVKRNLRKVKKTTPNANESEILQKTKTKLRKIDKLEPLPPQKVSQSNIQDAEEIKKQIDINQANNETISNSKNKPKTRNRWATLRNRITNVKKLLHKIDTIFATHHIGSHSQHEGDNNTELRATEKSIKAEEDQTKIEQAEEKK